MSKKISNIFNLTLIIFLFYYSYRYIFKYNSETTSPTYSNTPFLFQIGKYVLLAILIFIILIYVFLSELSSKRSRGISKFAKKRNLTKIIYIISMFILLLIQIYQFVFFKSNNNLTFIMCFTPVFLIYCFVNKINISKTEKIFEFFLNFTIVYEFIQLLLYFTIDRLPALGYATGILTDVRFGGAWDDPNGFAILLSFYFPYVFTKYKGYKKYIYTLILFLMLMLTWSLTGIACLITTFIIYKLYLLFKNSTDVKRSLIKLCLGIILFCLILLLFFKSSFGKYYIESKMGSILLHLEGFKLDDLSMSILLGFGSIDKFSEVGYVKLLYQGGIFNLVLVLFLGISSIVMLLKLSTSNYISKNMKPFYLGILFYQLSFMISMLNLPLIYSFSNVGIFFIFILISFIKYNNLIHYKHSINLNDSNGGSL